MHTDAILVSMDEALAACAHPRLFETERGFQGQLMVELSKRIHLPDQAILIIATGIYYFSVFTAFMPIVSSIFRNLDKPSVVRFFSLDRLAFVKHSTLYM